MDTVDLLLAILHHLLVFGLAAILAAEVVLLRGELTRTNLGRLAGIDRAYGLIAMLVILVGVGRVFFGLKGWEFYVYSWSFWAKMAAFAGVGPAVDPADDPHPVLEPPGDGRPGLPGAGRRTRRRCADICARRWSSSCSSRYSRR